MNKEEAGQNKYQEIDFLSWVKFFFQNRETILAFIFLGMIAGIILSFILPVSYRAETYLRAGNYIYFKEEYSLPELVQEIKIGFYKDIKDIKVESPKMTGLIRIESEARSREGALEILTQLNEAILKECDRRMEERRDSLTNYIEYLEARKDALIQKGKEVELLELEIFRINRQIKENTPSSVIKEPTIFSQRELKPAIGLLVGIILGFFLGLSITSFKQWWDKNKKNIISNHENNSFNPGL